MPTLDMLEHQPNFPIEDLSDKNAEYLGLILSNFEMLKRSHQLAEIAYPIFTGTHTPLYRAAEEFYDEPSDMAAINYGIVAFEAMTLLVIADTPKPDLEALEVNVNGVVNPNNKREVENYFEKAQAKFKGAMPHTALVIEESSSSRHGERYRLSLLGSAIARQFELDNIAPPS